MVAEVKWNPIAIFDDIWYSLVMKKMKNEVPDVNLISVPAADFVAYYNANVPESFPRVSLKLLKDFREGHLSLFKDAVDEWSIDKHRKKLMDWLSSCPR